MKIFEESAQAMIFADRDAGRIGEDAPVWGTYENRTRAVYEVLKRRVAGTAFEAEVEAILKGEK